MTTPLYFPFDLAVLQIAKKLMPSGFDLTANDNTVNSLAKITEIYKQTGRVKVWQGASDDTIFCHTKVNFAFRAWRDYVHIINQYSFTQEGELATCKEQQRHVSFHCSQEQACIINRLLYIEVVEQVKEYYKTGAHVIDQRQFTLDKLKRMKRICN